MQHRAVHGETRAVARAVPAALGAIEVDLAAEVRAHRRYRHQLAVRRAVAGHLLAAVTDDVALVRREILKRPAAWLRQPVAEEPQAGLGVLLHEPRRGVARTQARRIEEP